MILYAGRCVVALLPQDPSLRSGWQKNKWSFWAEGEESRCQRSFGPWPQDDNI